MAGTERQRNYDTGTSVNNTENCRDYRQRYPERRRASKKLYYHQVSPKPLNHSWRRWTQFEHDLVMAEPRVYTERELAQATGRSIIAVQRHRQEIRHGGIKGSRTALHYKL